MMWMMWGGWMGPWMWFFLVYTAISTVAVLWALIDIARAKKDTGYKLIWAGISVVLGIIGVLLYYILEKQIR